MMAPWLTLLVCLVACLLVPSMAVPLEVNTHSLSHGDMIAKREEAVVSISTSASSNTDLDISIFAPRC
jgi:hypothetical protein